MSDHGQGKHLREQAIEALEQSTTMLSVASKLLDQGNVAEAKRLRDQARARRNISVWLMAKANTLEQTAHQVIPGSYHQSHSSTGH
jgi:hypothetical protein